MREIRRFDAGAHHNDGIDGLHELPDRRHVAFVGVQLV